ncbi:hypothetical protein AYI68_g212 [Smittium mucronatum]|uniref:Uncharacterized protein n=1 Tax=Smittium mucronatum TaxID=133383 RepID=A0A1R0H909_9FUNG|nr:hypothetical protein AYI68_g212 [Smittium mucronatum]
MFINEFSSYIYWKPYDFISGGKKLQESIKEFESKTLPPKRGVAETTNIIKKNYSLNKEFYTSPTQLEKGYSYTTSIEPLDFRTSNCMFDSIHIPEVSVFVNKIWTSIFENNVYELYPIDHRWCDPDDIVNILKVLNFCFVSR